MSKFHKIIKILSLKNMKGLDIALFIRHNENCTVSDIYKTLNISQVTVSIILNELKRLDLIECQFARYYRKYKVVDNDFIRFLDSMGIEPVYVTEEGE